MNERILELYRQAHMVREYPLDDPMRGGNPPTVYWGGERSAERFAELIVRECVDQIQPMWDQVQEIGPPPGYDYDTFDLAYNDCMNAIKEHFGVES